MIHYSDGLSGALCGERPPAPRLRARWDYVTCLRCRFIHETIELEGRSRFKRSGEMSTEEPAEETPLPPS